MVKASRTIVALLSAAVVALGLSSCSQSSSDQEPKSTTEATTTRVHTTSEERVYEPMPYASISDNCEYPNFEQQDICMPVPKDVVYTVTSDEPSTVAITYVTQDSPDSLWSLRDHVSFDSDRDGGYPNDVSPDKPIVKKGKLSYPERFAGIKVEDWNPYNLWPNYTCSIAIDGVVVVTDNDLDNDGKVTCMLSDEFLKFSTTEYRNY